MGKGAELLLRNVHHCKRLLVLVVAFFASSCELFKYINVLLKNVSFDVDTDANGNDQRAFSCHVVITYTEEMDKQIAGISANVYFNSVQKLERDYKDAVQIIKFDLMPGKSKLNQSIDVTSRFRAKGAYVIARYQNNGNTKANIGHMPIVIVKCKRNGIDVISPIDYAKKYKTE